MRILYVGDVMGDMGLQAIKHMVPDLRRERDIDVVIAQAENVTNGKGLSIDDYKRLRELGVDGFTGGNWTTALPETATLLNDPNVPVTGPANMPDCAGPGYAYVSIPKGKVLIISLLGQIVGRDADKPVGNPLQTIDTILASQQDTPKLATVVNLHGDFSSEKLVIGQYLDGLASLVVGDHWHIATADAMVLPKGTAHITDVGMCGSLDSCIGVRSDIIINRWKSGKASRNELETAGRLQFNAVLADIDDSTGLATTIEQIHRIW